MFKSKGGERATIRLKALSHCRFTGRLSLCVCEHMKWPGRGEESEEKQRRLQVQCKSPQGFTTKRNGEPLTLVMKLFEHLEKGIDNTFKITCPFLFTHPLYKEEASAPVKKKKKKKNPREHSRAATLLNTSTTSSIPPFVVTTRI